jgi:hypothetical protein
MLQLVEKVCFYKIVRILYPYKNALWALRPCKAFGRSISASLPNPQTPFPRKGAILLGLPPLDQARMLAVSHTKPLHDAVAQMAGDLYGGGSPKARTLWLLAKSFARCKTNKASNARHPILMFTRGFSTV